MNKQYYTSHDPFSVHSKFSSMEVITIWGSLLFGGQWPTIWRSTTYDLEVKDLRFVGQRPNTESPLLWWVMLTFPEYPSAPSSHNLDKQLNYCLGASKEISENRISRTAFIPDNQYEIVDRLVNRSLLLAFQRFPFFNSLGKVS